LFKLTLPIALAASSVIANPVVSQTPTMIPDPDNNGEFLCGLTFDISGYTSNDFQGSAINDIAAILFGANISISVISWDINLTTVGNSWADEATIGIEGQVFIIPGFGDSFGVTNMNYSSNGLVNLFDLGLPDIIVGADGIIEIEFFETGFDDNPGSPDAIYEAGSTISFYTPGWPTPGTASLLAFAGLIASRRKR